MQLLHKHKILYRLRRTNFAKFDQPLVPNWGKHLCRLIKPINLAQHGTSKSSFPSLTMFNFDRCMLSLCSLNRAICCPFWAKTQQHTHKLLPAFGLILRFRFFGPKTKTKANPTGPNRCYRPLPGPTTTTHPLFQNSFRR